MYGLRFLPVAPFLKLIPGQPMRLPGLFRNCPFLLTFSHF
jgi:hypothetical protein